MTGRVVLSTLLFLICWNQIQRAHGSIDVIFQFISYNIPDSTTSANEYCDSGWGNYCDVYFIFCAYTSNEDKCDIAKYTSVTWNNIDKKDLTAIKRNPQKFDGVNWQGRRDIFLKIDLWDEDTGYDDIIARFKTKLDLSALSQNLTNSQYRRYVLKVNKIAFVLNVKMHCSQFYYLPSCTLYCKETTTYSCNHQGQRICKKNFYGKQCTTFCKPSRSATEGFYNCTSDGQKRCLAHWYGKDCKVHCMPRNDSLGHYSCSSIGEKLCFENWFGQSCLIFCKPSSSKVHGYYTCDNKTGEKLCDKDWYGAKCTTFCVARDDDIAGHFFCNQTDGSRICKPNWFGVNCSCSPRDDNTGHYLCNENGRRTCRKDWYGLPSCRTYCKAQNNSKLGFYSCNGTTGAKLCVRDWYGANCTTYCSPKSDVENGHYICNQSSGAILCLEGWFGPFCKCQPRNDTAGHYKCNTVTGEKECFKDWYGDSCMTYCRASNDSLTGNYTCNSTTGHRVCRAQWTGPLCNCTTANKVGGFFVCSEMTGQRTCQKNYYGTYCNVYCLARNDSGAKYTCDKASGQKRCFPDYYGTNCSTYCRGQNNSNGHFYCDKKSGRKICHEDYYGSVCQTFCQARNDLGGHYSCNVTTGDKVCHQDYYGKQCTVYCKASTGNSGNYNCNTTTGEKICLPHYYGNNCKVYCRARNDSLGRYICNVSTGDIICMKDYYGNNCTTYCPDPVENKGQYVCNGTNGSKVCLEDYYGAACDTYCRTSGIVREHFYCNKSTGEKICFEHYYGENCSAFCMAHNDSTGHYSCHEKTGEKICHPKFYGVNCTTYCEDKADLNYTCDRKTGEKLIAGHIDIEIQFVGFSNLRGLDSKGKKCDQDNKCDTLLTLCSRVNAATGQCNVGQFTSKVWHDTNSKNFTSAETDQYVVFKDIKYPVSQNLQMDIKLWDVDNSSTMLLVLWDLATGRTNTEQTLIASFSNSIVPILAPSNETAKYVNYKIANSWQSITFRVRFYCARTYYLPSCTQQCQEDEHTRCNNAGEKVCKDNWHGESCQKYCAAQNTTTKGHYNCSNKGEKICHDGWYGINCTVYCKGRNDEQGHFFCSKDGMKICYQHWYGASCTVFCKESDHDKKGHYTCNSTTGRKLCKTNWYGVNCTKECFEQLNSTFTCDRKNGSKICKKGWFGPNCTCSPRHDSSGHYNCSEDGSRICKKFWHKLPDCLVYCSPSNGTQYRYTCDNQTGEKICSKHWYGKQCDLFCSPQNSTSNGFYTCNRTTGAVVCREGFVGPKCTCYPRNDSLGHYACNLTTGAKVCLDNWYGENCLNYCKSSSNVTTGVFSCNKTTGSRMCGSNWFGDLCNCTTIDHNGGQYTCDEYSGRRRCKANFYGSKCNAFCISKNSSAGRYSCDKVTGAKLCLKNYYGPNCTQYCRSPTEGQNYRCDNTTGTVKCLNHWYGETCNVYCKEDNSTGKHYLCDKETGRKLCQQDWYGSNCTVMCKEHPQRYHCENGTGMIICKENYYGESCKVFCQKTNSSEGHYTCGGMGEKLCIKGWQGKNCTMKSGTATTDFSLVSIPGTTISVISSSNCMDRTACKQCPELSAPATVMLFSTESMKEVSQSRTLSLSRPFLSSSLKDTLLSKSIKRKPLDSVTSDFTTRIITNSGTIPLSASFTNPYYSKLPGSTVVPLKSSTSIAGKPKAISSDVVLPFHSSNNILYSTRSGMDSTRIKLLVSEQYTSKEIATIMTEQYPVSTQLIKSVTSKSRELQSALLTIQERRSLSSFRSETSRIKPLLPTSLVKEMSEIASLMVSYSLQLENNNTVLASHQSLKFRTHDTKINVMNSLSGHPTPTLEFKSDISQFSSFSEYKVESRLSIQVSPSLREVQSTSKVRVIAKSVAGKSKASPATWLTKTTAGNVTLSVIVLAILILLIGVAYLLRRSRRRNSPYKVYNNEDFKTYMDSKIGLEKSISIQQNGAYDVNYDDFVELVEQRADLKASLPMPEMYGSVSAHGQEIREVYNPLYDVNNDDQSKYEQLEDDLGGESEI